MLAGCGGGKREAVQAVRGAGYSFEAPAGWTLKRTARGVSAADGERLVGVTTFTLRSVYRPALFPSLVPALDRVAKDLAAKEAGALTLSRTLVVAGMRARQYEIRKGDSLAQYTFVLKERREFQLLCRDGGDVCAAFVASFRLR